VVLGWVAILLIELLSVAIHPAPEGLDWRDPDAVAKFAATFPPSAFAIVLAAYLVGTAVGAFAAARFAATRPGTHGLIVAVVLPAAGIANLVRIEQPGWFIPFCLATFPVGAGIGLWIAARVRPAPTPTAGPLPAASPQDAGL
jgi:hypothetical protein